MSQAYSILSPPDLHLPFPFNNNVSSPKFKSLKLTHHPFSLLSSKQAKPTKLLLKCSLNNERERDTDTPSVATVHDKEPQKEDTDTQMRNDEEQQELDSLVDAGEEYRRNPSIENGITLAKKIAERKLKELDAEKKNSSGNFIQDFFRKVERQKWIEEKVNLERIEPAFKALDLNKLRSCFGFDTFFPIDVREYGAGWIFEGNLRKPIEEVMPKLEKKMAEATGREVVLCFQERITPQACLVQPKAEVDLEFEHFQKSTPWEYISAIALGVITFGTIALTSGFFINPDANVVPLFGGFLTILGVSEVATRWTASRYGVKLSPSFLVPSNWSGFLGVMNNYEYLLPNRKALFDIVVARTASAYLASLALAVVAFISDGSFNGGDNALFLRPQFFENNPIFSFIQYVIGPYADDLGNVLPYAVEGLGVPVDPLAFAGLLGVVVTSLNLLPCERLDGGRIAQAMFGRSSAELLSDATYLLLGIGGLSGSVLCITWGLFATFFRRGEDIRAKDEITPIGDDRHAWGAVLFLICFLTFFPNGGGTFSSSFFSARYFRL